MSAVLTLMFTLAMVALVLLAAVVAFVGGRRRRDRAYRADWSL